jgi:hypothetical protein
LIFSVTTQQTRIATFTGTESGAGSSPESTANHTPITARIGTLNAQGRATHRRGQEHNPRLRKKCSEHHGEQTAYLDTRSRIARPGRLKTPVSDTLCGSRDRRLELERGSLGISQRSGRLLTTVSSYLGTKGDCPPVLIHAPCRTPPVLLRSPLRLSPLSAICLGPVIPTRPLNLDEFGCSRRLKIVYTS